MSGLVQHSCPSFHRPDVQGLRAVAIVAVLLFHFYLPLFPNGYLGVDIFFAISGYLIFTIFSRSVQNNGLNWATISNFYYKRFARIVPLSLVYVCFAVLIYCYTATPIIISLSQIAATRALLFVTNIFFTIEPLDSFNHMLDENLFSHTWSLGLEVQFYLLMPILFLINQKNFGNSNIFYHVGAIASFAVYMFCPPMLIFMMPTRLWEFLAITFFADKILQHSDIDGIVEEGKMETGLVGYLSSIRHMIRKYIPNTNRILYYCSFVLLLAIPIFPFVHFLHGPARLIVLVSTVVVIALGSDVYNPVLSNPAFVFMGDISYSLYLFHWPFSVYFRGPSREIDAVCGIPLSIALSVAIYYTFEKHYRTWSKNVLLMFSMSVFVLAVILILLSPRINKALQKKDTITKAAAMEENEKAFAHWLDDLHHDKCNYSKWRDTIIAEPAGLCTMPKGVGKLKFLVVGNGCAVNMVDLVYDAFKQYFSEFNMFAMSNCEVFTTSAVCNAEFKNVIHDFAPDVVFVIQRYFMPTEALPPPGERDSKYGDMEKGFDAIYNMSSLFYVMDPVPSVAAEKMQELSSMIREGKSAETNNLALINDKDYAPAHARIKKLMEHCGAKCHLFDIRPAISDESGQVMTVDEESFLAIYEPHGHFTKYGLTRIAEAFNVLARLQCYNLNALAIRLYP